jgi:hypothetical protein
MAAAPGCNRRTLTGELIHTAQRSKFERNLIAPPHPPLVPRRHASAVVRVKPAATFACPGPQAGVEDQRSSDLRHDLRVRVWNGLRSGRLLRLRIMLRLVLHFLFD